MDDSNSPPAELWSDRGTFLNMAGGVEGGLALAAMLLAWLMGIDLWAIVDLNFATAWQTAAALMPLVALFAISYRWPIGPLTRIKRLLLEIMGPPLSACRWYDLVLLAGLAGLGEELLFRGVLQTGLERWLGPVVGVVLASLIFGVLHAVTFTYAVLATGIGVYLGATLFVWEPPNLAVPILVHALYDLVAFVILRHDYRRRIHDAAANG